MKAYHFTGETLRDGRPIPPIGEWLEHEGKLIPCESGLHASVHPFDALKYAPGNLLHLVEVEDYVEHGNPPDKVCARRRKILATIDAKKMLREFARWCALKVAHLWDCPEAVRLYLETGKDSLRAAAWDAAWDAAWAAARAAAWDAARDAARDAAWYAAWDAAWDAARAEQRNRFADMVNDEFGIK